MSLLSFKKLPTHSYFSVVKNIEVEQSFFINIAQHTFQFNHSIAKTIDGFSMFIVTSNVNYQIVNIRSHVCIICCGT